MRLAPAILVLAAAALPARADEFTDVVQSALDAYAAGDVTVALEELDYATSLLNEMRAAALAEFLPAAQDGWTREDAADAGGTGAAMAMFGGGTSAAASYRKGDASFTITLIANSPMVSGLGAMLTGMSSVAGSKPIRIERTQFSMNDGELQGVVADKVLVSVSGEAPLDAKTAHLEAMDFKALGEF